MDKRNEVYLYMKRINNDEDILEYILKPKDKEKTFLGNHISNYRYELLGDNVFIYRNKVSVIADINFFNHKININKLYPIILYKRRKEIINNIL